MLMASGPVTTGAQEIADENGVDVVGRDRLQAWMLQIGEERDRGENEPAAAVAPGGMRPAGQVLTGVLCCGLIMLIMDVFPPPLAAARRVSAAARPSANTVLSARERVVENVFAAINRRDWPAVWRLWYHAEPGYGPGYHRMISGSRLTERDVVTSIRSTGTIVTARVHAYETTGAVQSWEFRYHVHHGKITAGSSRLLGTRHP